MLQHNRFDKFTEQWLEKHRASGKSVYCRQECSGCCNLAVHATFPEAVSVAQNLTQDQKDRLSEYIFHLKEILQETSSLKEYLKRHRKQIVSCPFIDKQCNCGIYSVRPLTCRALLSTRPAEWCSVEFSELGEWDKQAYKSGLDEGVVAWPTHYVAATQDFARELEVGLLAEMKSQKGWSLSGNFAAMVWLEANCQISPSQMTSQQVRKLLVEKSLDSDLIFTLT